MNINKVTFDETYKPQNNKSGIVVGRLTVIKPIGFKIRNSGTNSYRIAVYECNCECGNICYISTEGITQGDVKSCGCLYKETRMSKALPENVAAFNRVFSIYKRNAKSRNLEFSLDESKFKELTKQNCYYCGTPPESIYKISTGEYQYNGIDRKNNEEGYTSSNSLPCCFACNSMKSTLSHDKFLNFCTNITNNHKQEN